MRSCDPIYPLPQGAFSIHINGDHNTFPGTSLIPEWKLGWIGESFSFGTMPSPNIPDLTKTRQDIPLPDSRIGTLEPSSNSNNEIITIDK